jgi:hypothetical protein
MRPDIRSAPEAGKISARGERTAGAKARVISVTVTALVNSCPSRVVTNYVSATGSRRSRLIIERNLQRRIRDNNYFCAGAAISFWYPADSVPLLFAIGSRVG